MIGTTISHYKITEKLGEGGMGVVYKADDTKLDRPVALKFLAPHLLRDEEGRKRFEREAKSAAKLDHPNICTVYEIDEVDGRTFIVMAFLGGHPLSERIKEGPLKLPEALSVAIQMAEGLEAAHQKGITHRDIKPDNVMLMAGSRGLVKLMDFGLAQLAGSSKFTREGTTLGTVNYMSPEQGEGAEADPRTDIWSLGVVLYEMVAGQRPFLGEFDQAIIFSIMNEPPEPLTAVRTGVPKELERITNKCLTKKADERYQDVTNLLVDLQACRRELEPQQSRVATPAPAPKRTSPMIFGGLAAVVLAALGLGWWFGTSSEPTIEAPPQYKLTQQTFDTGYTAQPAISPDGRLLAYASDRASEGNLDIWVQQVSGGDPIQLTSHASDEGSPSFSPDASQLVFRSQRDGGGIYLIAALGGSERLLAKSGQKPRFSPDGQRVAYSVGGGLRDSSVYVVPVSGGSPEKLETGVAWAGWPVWSPDGKHILFQGNDEETIIAIDAMDWWVVAVEGGQAKKTGAVERLREAGLSYSFTQPAWVQSPDRIILSARSGGTVNIYQAPLTPEPWRVEALPQRLTQGVAESEPSVADDGRIAFANIDRDRDIWSIAINANTGEVTGEPAPVVESDTGEDFPTVSADGKRLAFGLDRSGNRDVWVRDNMTGRTSALIVSPDLEEFRALLSPDGSTVAFMRGTYGNTELYVIPFEGGTEEKLTDGVSTIISWSADSKRVLYATNGLAEWNTIHVETGEVVHLLGDIPGDGIGSPYLSPDDRWLLFSDTRPPLGPGGGTITIAPMRNGAMAGPDEWVSLAEQSGRAWWSPDGNLAYFYSTRDGFGCYWAWRLDPTTKQPIGEIIEVLHMHDGRHSLSPQAYGLASDRLYLSVSETRSNIWLAEPVKPE